MRTFIERRKGGWDIVRGGDWDWDLERPRVIRWLRIIGAVLGIAGTALVVGHYPGAGYWLWTGANGCWLGVSFIRRDLWGGLMFGCYQAATVWGLWKR